jgi:hypothetical protein
MLTEEDKLWISRQLESSLAPLTIYAWCGEDANGSGRNTIKHTAEHYHLDKIMRLKPHFEKQARKHGKKIRLFRFVATAITAETEAGL